MHPSTQQQLLVWRSRPRSVLVLKRLGEESRAEFAAVVDYLGREQGMLVLVEPHELEKTAETLLAREEGGRAPAPSSSSASPSAAAAAAGAGATAAAGAAGAAATPPPRAAAPPASPPLAFLDTYTEQEASSLASTVDFVVCLGGDGLVLHASSLFRNAIPPVISFNMGSLGFLTNHSFHEHREALAAVISGRERLRFGKELLQKGGPGSPGLQVTPAKLRLIFGESQATPPLGKVRTGPLNIAFAQKAEFSVGSMSRGIFKSHNARITNSQDFYKLPYHESTMRAIAVYPWLE